MDVAHIYCRPLGEGRGNLCNWGVCVVRWGLTLVNVAEFRVLSKATEAALQVGTDAAVEPKPTACALRYRRARREDTGVCSVSEKNEHAWEVVVVLLKADHPECGW